MLGVNCAVILAGGASSRMGRPKAWLPMRNPSTASWDTAVGAMIAECEQLGIPVVVSVGKRPPEGQTVTAPMVMDDPGVRHALAGVMAGFRYWEQQRQPRMLVLPCDIRWSVGALGAFLSRDEPAYCAASNPLLGVFGQGQMGPFASAVRQSKSVRSVVAGLPRVPDPEGYCHFNTPDQLQRWLVDQAHHSVTNT